VTTAGALHLVLWYWPGAVPLDVTSGVWTALARDAAIGVLYRPLLGPAGYGGTRYMPLFFLLQGGLIRLGCDPVVAGLGLTAASAVLFDLALYLALRQVGARRALALPLSLLGHATVSVQLLTVGSRCDLLASALNLAGVASALRYTEKPRRAMLGASVAALAAAFFTKLTTVSGALAAIAVLRARRGRRTALAAAGALTLLVAAGLAAVEVASGGRLWTSLRAVAGGGISAFYGARFPFWFALAIVEDPFLLLVVLTALFYAVRETRQGRASFAIGYFWLTVAVTAPVFASPGTDNNHLIDLLGASILLVGHVLQQERAVSARLATAMPVALAGLTIVGWLPGVPSTGSVIAAMGRPRRQTITAILADAAPAGRILSEDPLLPVLAGGRAFVSDPFSLHVLAATRPEVRADFTRRLASGYFPTVVLVDWSGADAAGVLRALHDRSDRGVAHFYGDVRFTPDFLALLERRYVISRVAHPFVVFEWRPRRR
jgi:hypothetical protein